jgi:A/G-specific adenine glycosylase
MYLAAAGNNVSRYNEAMTILNSEPRAHGLEDLDQLRRDLLAWFAVHKRDLPWRLTRDPYRILVSEIMLQQTQVDRVLRKYQAFVATFPTLEALAAAPTADIIRAWSGLGYNRRAVNLQRAARAVIEEHGGQFPRDIAALRRLPGIGPYTAGAVACFAFEQDVAFMDTNIRRVVERVFVGPEAVSAARLMELAQAVIPAGQGWSWNQAIMELGALICSAASPACWRCPLRPYCRDYAARRNADEQVFAVPSTLPRRVVAERRETPYAGSSRFYRGRVVETLRQLPAGSGLPLPELGRHIKEGFTADDAPWLHELVAGLARDGLIAFDGALARLPE